VLTARHAGNASDEVIAAVVATAPKWDVLLGAASQGPQTLVHNDCRLDNLFFGADDTPIFIDWQVVSRTRGIQDVANLLAGSMDADTLAAQWERLLRRYHERLVGHGVRGYSLDQAIEHYRQNVFFPLAAGIALVGSMDIGDGRGLGDAVIARCLQHIQAIDAIDTLAAL
jgi:aminoglycoside phosphotransferase (APT) family kinase protein